VKVGADWYPAWLLKGSSPHEPHCFNRIDLFRKRLHQNKTLNAKRSTASLEGGDIWQEFELGCRYRLERQKIVSLDGFHLRCDADSVPWVLGIGLRLCTVDRVSRGLRVEWGLGWGGGSPIGHFLPPS